MPGDIGDAGLNNYFLENIYQVCVGRSDTLWHLPLFYPFPFVGGFSDNLFGAAPVYLAARIITQEPETAFQYWFLFSYIANFVACFYVLRRMGAHDFGASFGALVFTFALPTSVRVSHAQLSYRFGVPLAILFFWQFLETRQPRKLLICGVWLVWQFYCSIYIGFFTGLLLLGIAGGFVIREGPRSLLKLRGLCTDSLKAWRWSPQTEKILSVVLIVALCVLLLALFYPYLQVTNLYGFRRSASEIASMLPRPQSYFLADISWLWRSQSDLFATLPMRHEHQMFLGLLPILCLMGGCFALLAPDVAKTRAAMLLGLAFLVVITLSISGQSIWNLFSQLPLASAIRAMARLDLVLLFPVAYLAALGADSIIRASGRFGILAGIVLSVLFLFEAASITMPVSKKAEWQERLAATEAIIPSYLPKDTVLFFAQPEKPYFVAELDAMTAAQRRGVPTLNGYTGNLPPGFSDSFGMDSSELSRRILAWVVFSDTPDPKKAYFDLLKRILPLGFSMKVFTHNSSELRFEGWAHAESTHRWSIGHSSSISFSISSGNQNARRMRVKGWSLGAQRISIFLNGTKIHDAALTGDPERMLINLPSNLLKIGDNTLRLELPDAHVPDNGDPRVLGYALQTVVIE